MKSVIIGNPEEGAKDTLRLGRESLSQMTTYADETFITCSSLLEEPAQLLLPTPGQSRLSFLLQTLTSLSSYPGFPYLTWVINT